jgi:chromosome segregation ATPase
MAPATKQDVLKSKNVNFLLDQIKSIWDENAKLKKGNDEMKDKLQKKRTEILSLQGEIGKLKSAQKNENSSCGSCSHNCCQKLKDCKKDLECCQKKLKCCRDDLKGCQIQLQRPNNNIFIHANQFVALSNNTSNKNDSLGKIKR